MNATSTGPVSPCGKLALTLYARPTVGLFLQGGVYLTTAEFMPYHRDALGAPWDGLPVRHQLFLLGVIRAMGAGSLSVTLALAAIIITPWRRRERWALWAVPAIGIVFTVLTAYAAYTIDSGTPATTPWRATLALADMYGAGGGLTLTCAVPGEASDGSGHG